MGADTGVDPALVAPDLAVALVRSGFAKLKVGALVVDTSNIDTLASGVIVSSYVDPSAVILNG